MQENDITASFPILCVFSKRSFTATAFLSIYHHLWTEIFIWTYSSLTVCGCKVFFLVLLHEYLININLYIVKQTLSVP